MADDIMGGSESEGNGGHGGAGAASAKKKPGRGQKLGGSQCHLCSLAISETKPRTLFGYHFHSQCFLGVRCHRRLCSTGKNQDALIRSDRMMSDKPDEWRDVVMPLVVVDKEEGRDAAARRQVKRKTESSYTRQEVLEDDLVLNKRRYKSYVKQWDDLSSEAASEAFVNLHGKQDGEYDDSDEEMVRVRDNMRIRQARGREKRAEVEEDRKRSPKRSRRRGRDDEEEDEPQSGRKASVPNRGERPSGSSGCRGVRKDGDAESKSGSRARHSSSRLTSEALKLHDSGGLSSKGSACGDEESKRVKSVHFMRDRAKLKDRIEALLATGEGKISNLAKYKSRAAKLPNEKIKEMDKAPKETIAVGESAIAALRSLHAEMENLRASGYDAQKSKVESAIETWDEAEQLCADELEAVNFLLKLETDQKKKDSSKVRFARNKLQSALIAMGWGKALSKEIAIRAENPNQVKINAKDFNDEELSIWCTGDGYQESAGPNLFKALAALQQNCKPLATRQSELATSIRESPSWKGAGVIVECTTREHDYSQWPQSEKMFEANDEANCPWMTAVRPWAWRWGRQGWPLPGFGAWVQPFANDLDIMALLIPVGGVVKQGISLKDVQSFFETPVGLKYVSEQCQLVRLPPGCLAWIPYGMVAVPVVVEHEAAEDKDDQKEKADKKEELVKTPTTPKKKKPGASEELPLAFFWVWSPLVKEWACRVDEQAWAALLTENKEAFTKNQARISWSTREKYFSKFVAEVKKDG